METKRTQEQMVLEHFLAGRSITSLEALQLYGIIQLPCRIFLLNKAGWRINKERIRVVSSRGAKIVTRYSLRDKS